MREDDDRAASTRAGGNVVTKGPSRHPQSEEESGHQQARGDVATKGAEGGEEGGEASE